MVGWRTRRWTRWRARRWVSRRARKWISRDKGSRTYGSRFLRSKHDGKQGVKVQTAFLLRLLW